ADVLSIEGFDEDTADELQNRARTYLERIENERQTRRKALGVEDALGQVPGVTSAMLVAFGENDVKSVEDLAGCATDDLVGWTEKKGAETVRYPGYLSDLDVSRQEAEAMIMAARVAAGWVDEEDMAQETEETEVAEG
ncbi:MAG TPA: helix-hairpin-helix domain-containing protein, partial [Rhabdaerophilum sp.]|nr:helix-hairpin-helix domain-containing protein [Rhabdaerophilum sp.]